MVKQLTGVGHCKVFRRGLLTCIFVKVGWTRTYQTKDAAFMNINVLLEVKAIEHGSKVNWRSPSSQQWWNASIISLTKVTNRTIKAGVYPKIGPYWSCHRVAPLYLTTLSNDKVNWWALPRGIYLNRQVHTNSGETLGTTLKCNYIRSMSGESPSWIGAFV